MPINNKQLVDDITSYLSKDSISVNKEFEPSEICSNTMHSLINNFLDFETIPNIVILSKKDYLSTIENVLVLLKSSIKDSAGHEDNTYKTIFQNIIYLTKKHSLFSDMSLEEIILQQDFIKFKQELVAIIKQCFGK